MTRLNIHCENNIAKINESAERRTMKSAFYVVRTVSCTLNDQGESRRNPCVFCSADIEWKAKWRE